MQSSPIELELYPNNSFYIGKIKLNENIIKNSSSFSDLETVIILDRSGSMGSSTYVIVKKILPNVFEKLGYTNKEQIHLITFSTYSEIFKGNYEEIAKSDVHCLSETYLSPALMNLNSLISMSKKLKFRILTISDGILNDQNEAFIKANNISKIIKDKKLLINSQVIRYFTSNEEPDTKGLSSLLQLNNVTFPILEDLYSSLDNETLCNKLFTLFINDGLSRDIKLSNFDGDNIFFNEPWNTPSKDINLNDVENLFYIDSDYGNKILKKYKENNCEFIDDNLFVFCKNNNEKIPVKIIFKNNITTDNYLNVMERKLKMYLQKIKILKILNTKESTDEIDNIINFFNNFEKNLNPFNEILDNKLSSRLIYIENTLKKKKCEFTNMLKNIKNNDKINELNSRQQAEYLRKLNVDNKSSKQLAKRAINEGINFDEEIIKEVKLMKEHIKEIENIDDSNHSISFYSTCTTLDGIKEVCNIKEDLLEKLTAMDILKLINIVGIAINKNYENYIDPMLYRIDKIYTGSFVSISDIIMAIEVSGGKNLCEIGNPDNIITNVIPYYDDEKIHLFLLKYGKKILEYSSSFGMRKLIVDIPYTYEYNLLAGLWKLLSLLIKDKSEVNIKLFIHLIISYQNASGNHFDYVIKLIKNQKNIKNGKSIFINHNSMINMTNPLCYFVNNIKDEEDKILIKRILRAIYQFEVYQYFRTLRKRKLNDERKNFSNEILNDLLSIDFEKNGKKVNGIFIKENEEEFYDKYEINDFQFNQYLNKLRFCDLICIVPQFLKCAFEENPIENFKKIPINNIDENIFKENLGINYDVKQFKLFCIVQGLIYKERKERYDSEKKEMIIEDLEDENIGNKMIKDYIISQFKYDYNNKLKKKRKEEEKILSQEFLDKIIKCDNKEELEDLIIKGIKKENAQFVLKSPSDKIYNIIMEKLLDKKIQNIELRGIKILYLSTGKNLENKILWNKGNIVQDIFNKINSDIVKYFNEDEKVFYFKIKNNFSYIYRDLSNRSGHNNEKKSYWALGFKSIKEMSSIVDKQTMDEYRKIHINCCGLNKLNGVLSYKQLKRLEKKKKKKI